MVDLRLFGVTPRNASELCTSPRADEYALHTTRHARHESSELVTHLNRRLRRHVALALSYAFTSGPWEPRAMNTAGALALGAPYRFIPPLAKRLRTRFTEAPELARISEAIVHDQGFLRAVQDIPRVPRLRFLAASDALPPRPEPRLLGLSLPAIESPHDLAAFLGLGESELRWFSDPRQMNRDIGPRAHYWHRWIRKASGGVRLIEAPKRRLRALQKTIDDEILRPVPLHDAAHGFRKGRSVHSFVAPHAGRRLVLRVDLAHFFTSVSEPRVRGVFRLLGYPALVSSLLAGLCCSCVPERILRQGATDHAVPFDDRQRLRFGHLPQGASTSPALANLAAYRLDARLFGLAHKAGAHYTRYADDLAFSTDTKLAVDPFLAWVGAIVLEEGFALRHRKTQVMRSSTRQHLGGVVLNQGANIPRDAYDRLMATLHNCARHGPSSQNRDEHPDFRRHLEGRVSWWEQVSPARAAKLRRKFAQIDWAT